MAGLERKRLWHHLSPGLTSDQMRNVRSLLKNVCFATAMSELKDVTVGTGKERNKIL